MQMETNKIAGLAIFVSDKIDFETRAVTRDKEGRVIMIKWSIQKEDTTLVNIYAPNIGAPKYIQRILTDVKGEINSNTVILGSFNTP